MATVYKITFPNNKVYIGIATNIKKRLACHKHNAQAGSPQPVYRAIRYYGWESLTIEPLAECSFEEAKEKESELIKLYQSFGKGGYNATAGGDGVLGYRGPAWNKGLKLSEEYKTKMSNAKLGKKRGPRSQDEKDKISESNKGKPKSQAHIEALKAASKRRWAKHKEITNGN